MSERIVTQVKQTVSAANPPKRSRILKLSRKPNSEKFVTHKRKLLGEVLIEEWTQAEILELFRNA